MIHGSQDSDVFTFEGYHTYERAHAVDLANPTVSDGKFKAMLRAHKANHNQFNSIWASETPVGVAMPRASQEEIAKVHLGALAQAVLLDRAEYLDVLRDHGAAAAWDPNGTEFVSAQPGSRAGLRPTQSGGPHRPDRLAADTRYRCDGQRRRRASTDGTGRRRRYHNDHTSTRMERSRLSPALEGGSLDAPRGTVQDARAPRGTVHGGKQRRQSGSGFHPGGFERFTHAAIPASSLDRLLYPDPPPFGPVKIVMKTLRRPVERLVECGVDPTDLRSSLLYSTGERLARATSTICNVPTEF